MTHHYDDDEPQEKRTGLFARRTLMVLAPIGVIIGCVVLFGAIQAAAPKPEKKKAESGGVAVQVFEVEQRGVRATVQAQGEATPRNQAAFAAQVNGRIIAIAPNFAVGAAFRRGDTLVRIDDADYKLAVVRAQSQVAQAKEALAREEAEGAIARKDWEALGEGQKASPLTLREPQLAQAKAALAAAEAALRAAELDLERTFVRAPFDGRVRTRRVSIGDFASPSAPLGEIFATDIIEVRVPLTDTDLATLAVPVGFTAGAARAGPPAHVSATIAGVAQKWEGRLVRVEATVDATTRLVYGFIEVARPFASGQQPLAPGVFANVTLDGAREELMFATPRSALKRNEFIYVVKADNTIDVRNVRAAQSQGEDVYFREGIAAGEKVVVSVLPSPRQGMKVTPIARAPASAAAQ